MGMTFGALARAQRTIPVVHAEAFQLMRYDSDDGSDSKWFWNSRDGVTPFGTFFDGKSYTHAMGRYATIHTAVLPDTAEYVWVSYTPASWEAMQRRRFERFSDPAEGRADFVERFPKVEDWLAISPFEYGQPRHLTREEFLAETPEWYGRHKAETPEGNAA